MIWYISNNGNKNGTGTMDDPIDSFKNIPLLCNNDVVKFESGGTYYGSIATNFKNITLSSYGIGDKPIISGYKIIDNTKEWTTSGNNIYKINLSDASNYSGNTKDTGLNIGHIVIDGKLYGGKKPSKEEMTKQFDFYDDGSYFYIYSTEEPSTLFTIMKLAPKAIGVTLSKGLKIIGLKIEGFGAHAIGGGYMEEREDIQIISNVIENIGGSYLNSPNFSETTRYGNGIEFLTRAKNAKVKNNKVFNCYDVAFTMQGNAPSDNSYFENVLFENNIDFNNTQSFEIWYQNPNNYTNIGFKNCKFRYNTSIHAGFSWGEKVRPDKNSCCLLNNGATQTAEYNIECYGNVFFNPKVNYMFRYPPFKTYNNKIYLRESANIVNHNSSIFKRNQYSQFLQTTGKEKGSKIYYLKENAISNEFGIKEALEYLSENVSYTQEVQKNILEDIMSLQSDISEKIIDLKHNDGRIKNYISEKTPTTDDAKYCKVFETITTNKYSTTDVTLFYSLVEDSIVQKGGIGLLYIKFVPATDFASSSQDLRIVPLIDMNTEKISLKEEDFVAIINNDSVNEKSTLSVYFNIGKKAYSKLCVTPLIVKTHDRNEITFYNKTPLVTLPEEGQQFRFEIARKTTISNQAPNFVPLFVGQEVIDTIGKKIYKAIGIKNTSDWVKYNLVD